jgi:membrane-associated phospholipid phosphatase
MATKTKDINRVPGSSLKYPARRRLQNFLVMLAIGTIFVTCCYFWIDRPLAFWVHAHQSRIGLRNEIGPIARIPNPAVLASLLVFLVVGCYRLAKHRCGHFGHAVLASSISVLVGETIKEVLKWVFGRPSPDIWIMSNSSVIGSRGYQFHWFQGIEPFNSFPSGHMTAVTAATAILWMQYPQFRPLYLLCCAIVATGLVALNFHFLGDVAAGALLGTAIGLLVYYAVPERNEATH